jgi:hypothetical protein
MAKKRKSTRKKARAGSRMSRAAVPRTAPGGCSPNSPDRRFPVHGDPYHEIVCKCVRGAWVCRQVPTGGDWSP